jgi:hypothetical protein
MSNEAYPSRAGGPEATSGTAVGFILFAAIMMIMSGVFQAGRSHGGAVGHSGRRPTSLPGTSAAPRRLADGQVEPSMTPACSGSCAGEEPSGAVDIFEVRDGYLQGDVGAGRHTPPRSWGPGAIGRVA